MARLVYRKNFQPSGFPFPLRHRGTQVVPGTIPRNGRLTSTVRQRRPVMSDPRYTDPRYDQPPLQEPRRPSNRASELESSNAMWGWIAGAVVLALVLVFIFGRMNSSDMASDTTTTTSPPATTGMAPPRNPERNTLPAQRPTPAPAAPSTPTHPAADQGTAR